MVWHLKGQNTPITVCVEKKGRKGVFESQCCGKGRGKTKTPKTAPFPLFFLSSKTPKPTTLSTIFIQTLYENAKMDWFNKKHKTAVTPFFEMVLSVVSTLFSLKPQNTTHTMVEWWMTTMMLPICNELPPTPNKGMRNISA